MLKDYMTEFNSDQLKRFFHLEEEHLTQEGVWCFAARGISDYVDKKNLELAFITDFDMEAYNKDSVNMKIFNGYPFEYLGELLLNGYNHSMSKVGYRGIYPLTNSEKERLLSFPCGMPRDKKIIDTDSAGDTIGLEEVFSINYSGGSSYATLGLSLSRRTDDTSGRFFKFGYLNPKRFNVLVSDKDRGFETKEAHYTSYEYIQTYLSKVDFTLLTKMIMDSEYLASRYPKLAILEPYDFSKVKAPKISESIAVKEFKSGVEYDKAAVKVALDNKLIAKLEPHKGTHVFIRNDKGQLRGRFFKPNEKGTFLELNNMEEVFSFIDAHLAA